VYSRKIGDKELTFGVSGLLYKANVLMYDRQTESLWSQVLRKAVTGPMTDTPLTVLPSTLTTWKRWKKRHPDTLVLSLETGHRRDYTRDPYESYYESSRGFFSRVLGGPGEEEKMLVAGVPAFSGDPARRRRCSSPELKWGEQQRRTRWMSSGKRVPSRTKWARGT
jgi:hypothetical protein